MQTQVRRFAEMKASGEEERESGSINYWEKLDFCPEGAFVQESLKNPMCVCPFVRPVSSSCVLSVTFFGSFLGPRNMQNCKEIRKKVIQNGIQKGTNGINPGNESWTLKMQNC